MTLYGWTQVATARVSGDWLGQSVANRVRVRCVRFGFGSIPISIPGTWRFCRCTARLSVVSDCLNTRTHGVPLYCKFPAECIFCKSVNIWQRQAEEFSDLFCHSQYRNTFPAIWKRRPLVWTWPEYAEWTRVVWELAYSGIRNMDNIIYTRGGQVVTHLLPSCPDLGLRRICTRADLGL